MRAVIQRVTRASVTVNGGEPRAIGPGLVILLGVRGPQLYGRRSFAFHGRAGHARPLQCS